jgi:hypothetical protein
MHASDPSKPRHCTTCMLHTIRMQTDVTSQLVLFLAYPYHQANKSHLRACALFRHKHQKLVNL